MHFFLTILAGVGHAHDRAALDLLAQLVGADEKAPNLVRFRCLYAASDAGLASSVN
jgi:hypothetical protein